MQNFFFFVNNVNNIFFTYITKNLSSRLNILTKIQKHFIYMTKKFPFMLMEHSSRKNNILVILFRDKNKRRLIKPPNIVLCIIHQYLTNAFNLMYDFSHNET
jgi:hypothetical protein